METLDLLTSPFRVYIYIYIFVNTYSYIIYLVFQMLLYFILCFCTNILYYKHFFLVYSVKQERKKRNSKFLLCVNKPDSVFSLVYCCC